MVRAFEVLCPFFNIWPSATVFHYFFIMKLTSRMGWVSLNCVSKKLFKFDSNVFLHFKDHFFKFLTSDVVAYGLPLMFNQEEEPRFMFYWQFDLTSFKSLNEDLLTLLERVDKAILEQLSTLLDVRIILSVSDPLIALDSKVPYLVLFVSEVSVRLN